MGREIRRVVPNWEHPIHKRYDSFKQKEVEEYQPLYDESYLNALNEWLEGHQKWESGEDDDRRKHPDYRYYADWNGNAPRVEYYRPDWNEEEMTWFQVYETVSEGTPVTPAFSTQQELVDYLVENGDFWDQKRRAEGCASMPCDPWTREQAERFVFGSGYMPSMVVSGGNVLTGAQIMDLQP